MDPQRTAVAGPMASFNEKTSKKSFAVTNTLINKESILNKDITTVHSSSPHVEKRSYHVEQNQIYQGEINVLSIM